MILYGWGRKTAKTYHSVLHYRCTGCDSVSPFHIIIVKTWFHLFYLPIIPYRTEYYIRCSSCGRFYAPNNELLESIKSKIKDVDRKTTSVTTNYSIDPSDLFEDSDVKSASRNTASLQQKQD
jgi:uncharacterized Zn finger protein